MSRSLRAPHPGLLLVAFAATLGVALPTSAQELPYERAERLLNWHTDLLVSGDQVNPEWMGGGSRFWYRNKTSTGHEFVFVDAVANSRRPLFDHYRLAASMTMVADSAFSPDRLPFNSFRFLNGESVIEFKANRRRWTCNIQQYDCQVGDTVPSEVPFVVSPDSTTEAFVIEHDVWTRPFGGGDSTRITTDGEEFNSYGLTFARPNQRRDETPRRPSIRWSPDSGKLLVERRDERGVEHMHYISYTAQRPEHYSQPYALPGDTIVPVPGIHILNLQSGANLDVDLEPVPNQLSMGGSSIDSVWASDSRTVYVAGTTRASKMTYLAAVDVETGEYRLLASDSSKTFVETSQRNPTSWYVSEDGNDVFWWSERDGWAHIWRLDANGVVKNQVTRGPFTVGAIQHVDERNRTVYFTAHGHEPGRNPYYAHLYRSAWDGSGMTLITPEDGHHQIEFSPDGRFFTDQHSQIGVGPVTLLRAAPDGRVVRTLEEADLSRLVAAGWRAPEVFTVKARDGLTDIYGLLYLPPDYDPTKKYPVINHIYPGPQVGSVGSWSFKNGGEAFALAELGFIVLQIDHLGTPLRNKAFHDNYYGNFIDNGLPDHVGAIKQVATRIQGMDLDRVGIYGHSGGAFASTDALLRYPDFFKVAVSSSGNHDNRSYNIYWSEKYQGLLVKDTIKGGDNFDDAANKTYVENLRGRLLLMHGDMDDNVHPGMTIQLIDALIKANKDFDLIWAPNRPHSLTEPYFIRRRWDYFVEHLMGAEPPREYQITRPAR